MNKNISSEVAIGIILVISILTGGIFWIQEERLSIENKFALSDAFSSETSLSADSSSPIIKEEERIAEEITCKPRYYEGETEIQGWLVSPLNDGEELNIQIKTEDVEKLPVLESGIESMNFIVTLVDPTEEIARELQKATQENPVSMTLRGYNQNCQSFPQISLKAASIAFKKS